MNKEKKFVVDPLKKYFLDRGRSGARWKVKHTPAHDTSETGWDLQVEHKNKVLLIEAKYIIGPAASAIAGLTISPLVYRLEKMKNKSLYRSRYYHVCWAIGCGYTKGERDQKYEMSGVYQILFDCFILNLNFWKRYKKLVKMKYIYFVNKKKGVGKIDFDKFIDLATGYKARLDKHLRNKGEKGTITEVHRRKIEIKTKRSVAESLIKLVFK